ncbi:hypothetical protein [Pseudomonas sp. LB3P25]
MNKALSQLSPSLKASFKQNLILFTKQGNYAPYSYSSIIAALVARLNAHPTSVFDIDWIARALANRPFNSCKNGITQLFLNWKERDTAAISLEALDLLNDAAYVPARPRNVHSDDPKKSWLTEEEYDDLLSTVWDNYDRGIFGTQVTLIKLLSMQYARRPLQIAYLKIGDVRENDGSDSLAPTGKIIYFPGAKDQRSEINFRDSKFEPHCLADYLWDLCQIQCKEVRTLYEHVLGFSLTDDQLKKLPLFFSKLRVEQSLQLIEVQHRLNLLENLDNELFHLRKISIGSILCWTTNTPTCHYDAAKLKRSIPPKPPISPRTGQILAVNATRMRHTRARQLARKGIPNHLLSHWLGHSYERC